MFREGFDWTIGPVDVARRSQSKRRYIFVRCHFFHSPQQEKVPLLALLPPIDHPSSILEEEISCVALDPIAALEGTSMPYWK